MINRIYRLMDTKRIEMVQREVPSGRGLVLTRPDYMSVCAADQRYYFGQRKREILDSKLPMALIHEATATVLYDADNRFPKGAKVVLVPLIENETGSDTGIKGNYDPENIFRSSGYDGFMCDYAALPASGVVQIPDEYSPIYVFSELVSVVLNAVEAFEKSCRTPKDILGVWGDGSVGYVTSLILKCLFPESRVYVFGKNPRKLLRFSFADETLSISAVPRSLNVNHCFECVGGLGSESAIEQMTDLVLPQGCVNLLGVSEEPVSVNTRRVLDKGLQLIGHSRSAASDMQKAVTLIHENETCRKYLELLISEVIEVRSEDDIPRVFEQDNLNDFKTVIKWAI